MDDQVLPAGITGLNVYMVGIKGTGMAALAEILVGRGALVSGADVAEVFYTDALLRNVGINYHEGFAADHLCSADPRPDLVVYSAAYNPESHPELLEARRLGIPSMLYPEALGALSRQQDSVGIAGVHGKTTTTAILACMVNELGLHGTVLVGSALANLGGRATLVRGDSFFIAETCEYRRNFLSFSPRAILITSVEPDHLDYFKDRDDIEAAFVEYGERLATDGALVYCSDDVGATRVATAIAAARPDVTLLPYGFSAEGAGAVRVVDRRAGTLAFTIGGHDVNLHIPGDHNALNSAGAALVMGLVNAWSDQPLPEQRVVSGISEAITSFRGTRRRSEIVGEAGGVLILDDYAHHPTAIATTLAGFRSFYPDRRIVLSFMSHTYSRTLALLDDFAQALSAADVLVLHDIYASAREENPGGIDGEVLAVAAHRHAEQVHYVPAVLDAAPLLERILRPGDLFVTMGAGNNWELGLRLRDRLSVGVTR